MARPTAYARGACPHHQHPARIAATGRRLVLPHAKALDLGTRTAQDRVDRDAPLHRRRHPRQEPPDRHRDRTRGAGTLTAAITA
jgi:hypothetical protein